MRGATLFLLFASSVGIGAPTELAHQTITLPPNSGFPLFVDLYGNGRSDLLVLDGVAKTLFIYRQSPTGFTNSPSQIIPLPPGTIWVAPGDVDVNPGIELLFCTSVGVAYARQNAGRFESERRELVAGRQVFTNTDYPFLTLLTTNRAKPNLASVAIPVISEQQAVVYRRDDAFKWMPDPPVPLNHQPAYWHADTESASWAIACKDSSSQPSIRPSFTIRSRESFLAKSAKADRKELESEAIRKLVADLGTNGMSGPATINRLDIDNDGRQDVVVWQVRGWFDFRTDLFLFLRGPDQKLPERPTQILHCRGFPVPVGSVSDQTPLADINGDGVCELILLEPKTTILSPNSLLEMALSHQIAWSLTIRLLKRGRISNEPEASIPLKMLLSLEDLSDWPICIEGDFNRDGRPDLLVRRTETEWNIYLSTKDNRWFDSQPAITFTAPVHGSLEIEDINNDGRADITWREPVDHRISIFINP
jgi:hypothetical protein